jgi:hypothetical protein
MLSSNDERELLIINLKIISQIKEHEKLSIKTMPLTIHPFKSSIIPFLRWFYGDSRELTLKKVKTIIDNAIKLYEHILTENEDQLIKKESLTRQEARLLEGNKHTLQQLWKGLQTSIEGLHNLKTTYINDNTSNARLDMIIDNISNFISIYDEYDEEK